MPMYSGLKFPANSMLIIEYLINLASFNLIPTEAIDSVLYYWPEADPFNTNFEMAGIGSELLLSNIGFAIYLVYLHCLAAVIHAILFKKRSNNKYLVKLLAKLGAYLYWEGLNRFFIELFLDLALLDRIQRCGWLCPGNQFTIAEWRSLCTSDAGDV